MCQNKIRYLVRRNFNHEDEGHKHRLSMTTVAAQEGQAVLRQFPSILKGVDTIVFVEKIPSREAELQLAGSLTDRNSLGVDKSTEEEAFDVRVSVKWEALFRISQHLDRPELVFAMKVLWAIVPQFIGNWYYDRVARKRMLYGRADCCVSKEPQVILGLKERLWKFSK